MSHLAINHDLKPVPPISYAINIQYCTKILEVVFLDEIPPSEFCRHSFSQPRAAASISLQ